MSAILVRLHWGARLARATLLRPTASLLPPVWRFRLFATSSTEPEAIRLDAFKTADIRNFSIIAHIDHGKSTLADRLLETTGTIGVSSGNKQVLDKLQVEQERGITVKAQTATMFYTLKDKPYLLNLIDTPGHVDFNYEVRCSLAACQGCLLVVDATQGVQAQTVANYHLANDLKLAIIPVINKIDMPIAEVEKTKQQLKAIFNFDEENIICVSAKTGINMDRLLEAVVSRIPSPPADIHKPFTGLIFDSWHNEFRGVISLIEIINGKLERGDKIVSSHTGKTYEVAELGILSPNEKQTHGLYAGQVGYIIPGMKTSEEAFVGDTLYKKGFPVAALPGFKAPKPMVFAGVFPVEQSEIEAVTAAIGRLTLHDSGVEVRKDMSVALGAGWRIGFLGLLHMDVFRQRLEQEHDVEVIVTSPSVGYKAILRDGTTIDIDNPDRFPETTTVQTFLEPMVNGTLIVPTDYIGKVIELCETRRGVQTDMIFMDDTRVMLKYKIPLNEIVEDFFDALKARSSGYASFDYEECGFQASDIVKLQIVLNGVPVDALSTILHYSRAFEVGKALCLKLKDTIPKHLFEVAIQAVVRGKPIARETVRAIRKDVTAKCYGGDISRKMKLLQKQKEGKKRMRTIGNVQVPKEAFAAVLRKAAD